MISPNVEIDQSVEFVSPACLITLYSVVNAWTSNLGTCTREMADKIHFNSFLCPSTHDGNSTHLVILNSDSFNSKLTASMWGKCDIKVCADGGANRLFDSLTPENRTNCIPDYIVGDLDSLRSEVKDFYEGHGTVVKKMVCQNENDLDKAVMLIRSVLEAGAVPQVKELEELPVNPIILDSNDDALSSQIADGSSESAASAAYDDCARLRNNSNSNAPVWKCTIVLMGAYGGRFDQEMAAMSSLFRWLNVFDRMVLLGSHACSFLLQPGCTHRIRPVHTLHLQHQTGTAYATEGPTCGLIPIGGTVRSLTTTGLQWNLHQSSLQLGVLISSSNHILPGASEVTVVTSDTVLWTVQMHVL